VHLRSFTWGNVRQLEAVNRLLLGELARRAPLLPGRDTLAFVDIDAMQKRVYGHRKQGAGFGHTKIQGKSLLVRGLNALAATICTPLGAPVIAATRLRGGTANSARGAARFAAGAIAWDALVEEAAKCQLLCKPCHVAKGAEDRPELKHGTYHVYWYWNCRCDPCKAANARKSAALRAKRQNAMPATNGHGEPVNSEFSVTAPEHQEGPERVSAAQDPLPLPRQDSNLEPAG
jgi:hypothetical protein